MKDLIEKDPAQIIRRAVKGMIPKNTIREDILDKNLIVHAGLYHNHVAQKLPQFTQKPPQDINLHLGIKGYDPKTDLTVIYESDPANPPEEFKDVKREIDYSIDVPLLQQKKTHTVPMAQVNRSKRLQRNY